MPFLYLVKLRLASVYGTASTIFLLTRICSVPYRDVLTSPGAGLFCWRNPEKRVSQYLRLASLGILRGGLPMLSQSDPSSGAHVVQDPYFGSSLAPSATNTPESGKEIPFTVMTLACLQMSNGSLEERFSIRPRSMMPSIVLLADVLGSRQSRGSLPSSPYTVKPHLPSGVFVSLAYRRRSRQGLGRAGSGRPRRRAEPASRRSRWCWRWPCRYSRRRAAVVSVFPRTRTSCSTS